MSNAFQAIDFNLRAGQYLIAQTLGTCPRCQRSTRLVGLGLPPGHEVLELDDDARDEAAALDTWAAADHAAFLFHVVHLSENIRSQMAEASPAYRLVGTELVAEAQEDAQASTQADAHARVPAESGEEVQAEAETEENAQAECYWANHCEHCGAQFDDQELFCEPGGAFLPCSEDAARRISLLAVNEALFADAAGYAQEPALFDSMRRI